MKKKHSKQLGAILFCLEHTGVYSLGVACFMEENHLVYSLIAGLEIKRSMGIIRGKNHKIDAFKIAEYAYLRRKQIQPSKTPSHTLLKIKDLLTTREKMVKHRGAYQSHLKGLASFHQREKILFSLKVRRR